jgi:serine protease Do
MGSLSKFIASAVGSAGPAVVGLRSGRGPASGVVIADGVVAVPAYRLTSDEPHVRFSGTGEDDNRREPARVLGVDHDSGLAVLAVHTGGITPPPWAGDGDAPPIGAAVVALANPGGRGLRATAGYVSAGPRSFRGPRGRRLREGVEHTAAVSRGSGGGPLLDERGQVIAINAMRLEGGLVLALRADAALRRRLDALGRGEEASGRRLGVAVAPPEIARRLRRAVGLPDRDGVLVRAVEVHGPADRAGIEKGDLIVTAAGQAVKSVDALHTALDQLVADQTLALDVVRGLDERSIQVDFAKREDAAA